MEINALDPFLADPFQLNRFVEAQASIYATALAELHAGQKRTHWSWFILPQIQGLGMSQMSVRYAVSGIKEARAYLSHPVLGRRLIETIAALLSHHELSAEQILGRVDALKLHSCLTLFNLAAPDEALFKDALDQFFSGTLDAATLAIIKYEANISAAN
jgi:uncharacterized protein (DUF1810 family)